MDYVNIDITVISDPQEDNSYIVTARTTGRTSEIASWRFLFSVETSQLVEPSLAGVGLRDATIMHDHARQVCNFGKQLFDCLINGAVRQLYDNKKQSAIKDSKILRLRLILVPLELVILPWEILFDERSSEYLCLMQHPKTVLIRSIANARPSGRSNYSPPLNIFGMVADPRDLPALQSEREKMAIDASLDHLVKSQQVDIIWERGRHSKLFDFKHSDKRWDVFHFIGHGLFSKENQQGQLAFEDDNRLSRFIPAEIIRSSLHPATKLVVLNACETARGNRFDISSNIAYSLASKGIPAVVAMQFKILDSASNQFSKTFYQLLAKGITIDEAVAEARYDIRNAANDPNRFDWAAPILYVGSSNIIAFRIDQKREAAKLEEERLERDRLEEVRLEVARLERDRLEAARLEEERLERDRLEAARLEEERLERDRLEAAMAAEVKAEKTKRAKTRLAQERTKIIRPGSKLALLPFVNKYPHWLYISLVAVIVPVLCVASLLIYNRISIPTSQKAFFPSMCSGNFASGTNSIVSPLPTQTIADGESIGLSEGLTIFDVTRSNAQEVQYKKDAAAASSLAQKTAFWNDAYNSDPTDAEAQIYLEDQNVLTSSLHPHITIVVGVTFAPIYAGGTRGVLQAALTAQKECNARNQQAGQAQVVLILANIGGTDTNTIGSSAKYVATQIATLAMTDKTIIGIMGWAISEATEDVNYALKGAGSILPMVAPSASSDQLENMSNFFRICPPDKDQVKLAASYMQTTMKKKNMAILYDSENAYTSSLERDFAADILPAKPILGAFTLSDKQSLQKALTAILRLHPDAIYFAGYVDDLVGLLNELPSHTDAPSLIVGGDALAITNDYIGKLPTGLDKVYFTAFSSPNMWDGKPQPPFFSDFQKNFGQSQAPTGLPGLDVDVLLGYDAMLALFTATQHLLATKKTINPFNLNQALKGITGTNAMQGVTGRISFDRNTGSPQNKSVFLEHIDTSNLSKPSLQVVPKQTQGCFFITDPCNK